MAVAPRLWAEQAVVGRWERCCIVANRQPLRPRKAANRLCSLLAISYPLWLEGTHSFCPTTIEHHLYPFTAQSRA